MNPYYKSVTRDHRTVHNKAAHAEWFESTEPHEGEPTHGRITSVARLEMIGTAMIGRLMMDLIRNARVGWQYNTPLESKRSWRQPLADIQPDPRDYPL